MLNFLQIKALIVTYLQIALPTPLYKLFDYLPASHDHRHLVPGMRVRVPFGRQQLIGIFIAFTDTTDVANDKLKSIIDIIDKKPCLTDELLWLCQWASRYYHHPLGEVLTHSLPIALRQGKAAQLQQQRYWQMTADGEKFTDTLKRAPKQQQLLDLLQQTKQLAESFLIAQNFNRSTIQALEKKGLIASVSIDKLPPQKNTACEHPHPLNQQQQTAVDAICQAQNTFGVFLLQGITGSGKTEVYLHCIEKIIAHDKQVLVLVPEIGLTPQTLARFAKRFSVPMAVHHSALGDNEKLATWLLAKEQHAKIIIGTRSAVFSAANNLGLIIIDESHDTSFKQQEGFRYSARDLAVIRAQKNNIPIVLGSATPSLESLHNVSLGRYQLLTLTERAGNAKLPDYHLIDIRDKKLHAGLSEELIAIIKQHVDANNQVLLFLNRRGYAPTLICHHCGWVATCNHCDARMTLHLQPYYLHCHHCDHRRKADRFCEKCHDESVYPLGQGTERVEQALTELFPNTDIVRVDRDTVSTKRRLEDVLEKIQHGRRQILIGTQMLAKGHHFPNLTLVALLDVDGGLLSPDFRAIERTSQLLIQVAGRAGREEQAGSVYLQTRNPDHVLLQQLITEGYNSLAQAELKQREDALFPPFSHFALLRSEAKTLDEATQFLNQVKTLLQKNQDTITLLGPIAAPMEKRKGAFRAQLLLHSRARTLLQKALSDTIEKIAALKKPHKLKWSIDVDPQDMY